MSLFVTLEGIEGAGKSVQMHLVEQALAERGVPCLFTCQPGGTPFGRQVREILLLEEGPAREPLPELLLYLADRCQHLAEVIEPALAAGQHVICDRYQDASRVYQGFARGIGFDLVDRLGELLGLRIPDLTLVLDLDVEAGLERARRRNEGDKSQAFGRFEAETLAFHRRVREGYHLLARREPERVRIVDASGSPNEVFERICPLLGAVGVME